MGVATYSVPAVDDGVSLPIYVEFPFGSEIEPKVYVRMLKYDMVVTNIMDMHCRLERMVTSHLTDSQDIHHLYLMRILPSLWWLHSSLTSISRQELVRSIMKSTHQAHHCPLSLKRIL